MELTLDQALQKGVEAHKAGNFQEADRFYTAILKANPKHPDANHNMGVLAVGVGKVIEALPFFKTALEANPSTAQYWLSYIDALIKLDRIADAQAVYDSAKSKGAKGQGFDTLAEILDKPVPKTTGKDREPHHEILKPLIDLYHKGLLKQAVQQAELLSRRYPKSFLLLNIQGALFKGLGNLNLSIEAYRKALSLQPDNAEAWNNLAVVLKNQGKLEEAVKAYNKALLLKPEYAEAWNNIGNALKDQNKLDEAIEAYNKSLAIDPNHAEAYYNMGVSLKERGKLKQAIEVYKKALLIKPDYLEASNNIGIALEEEGKLEEAIAAYRKALSIEPDYSTAYNNMGNALQKQGKLEEAIDAFKKAVFLKPDYADAYNNMGVTFQNKGNLEGAIKAYEKVFSLQHDNAKAYYNMGIALRDQGKLEEAIEAFKKAVAIKPDYAQAWNNLYFPLQAIKTKISLDSEIEGYYPKNIHTNYAKIELDILDFKLHRGHESEGFYLGKAVSSLSSADNLIISNPSFDKNQLGKIQKLPEKMFALVHFGRSGTGLMHSFFDWHPEISTLPSIYFSEYFDHSTWARIISAGWNGMVDQFAAIFDVLFDATSSVPILAKNKEFISNMGVNDGMANVGDQKNEVLSLDKNLFKTELQRLITHYDKLDAFLFFKLVHKAYDKALDDHNLKSLIFYHAHNPDTYAQLNLVRFNPCVSWILMVREPVQSCESWIRRSFRENDHFGIASKILTMLFEIDNPVYSGANARGVRLEDLKIMPRKTIPSLCGWMGIQEKESLYEMTSQGKRWWGDPNSPDYEKDGQDPFGKTSIQRKVGLIFSKKDQFIFRTLFYPFNVRFGYVKENSQQFKVDLKTIRPLLDETFDFEKKMMGQIQGQSDSFINSGSYVYLRAGLIERWNTLNKFRTYPNMIRPLKI